MLRCLQEGREETEVKGEYTRAIDIALLAGRSSTASSL